MRKVQIVLLILIIGIIGFFGWRLYRWNQGTQSPEPAAEDDAGEDFDIELMDQIYTLSAEQLSSKKDDGKDTILCLGNDSLAWDYDNGLSRILGEVTGREIRNGAFPASTVSVSTDKEMGGEDLFSFFHIAEDIAAGDFSDLEQPVRDRWEENYNYQTSYETLVSTDYAALDTILIYYDGEDYLRQRSGYNPDGDKMWTDVKTMTGAYATGIRAIRAAYPHIRLILVTPPLMVTYTPEGTPVAADRFDMGHGTLSTYIEFCFRLSEACGVTVIDNYHGMSDEENTNGYMVDTRHFSETGNRALAAHIARVLAE